MTFLRPALLLFVLFEIAFGCDAPPWTLKRADPGSGAVSFFNNTVSGSHMLARWTWRDSSGGHWDTRIRVTLNDEDVIGGGFTYSDQYENELASVRWYRIKADGPIKWKYSSFASPPDSWWMTAVAPVHGNMTWGFKNQITDGAWVFKVGNDTLEPKNAQRADEWSQQHGMMRNRWKRSLQRAQDDKDGAQNLRIELNDLAKVDDDYMNDGDEDIFQTIMGHFKEFLQSFKVIEDFFTKLG